MIHILVLCYNEEKALPGMVTKLHDMLSSHKKSFRVVVVDDGSTDKTAAAARDLARRYPLVLLSHGVNQGVAKAFNTGLRHIAERGAPEDVVVTMEGDGTNDPASLPPMLAKMDEGFDVVCASRYCPGGAYVGFPLYRRALSLAANWLTRLVFGVPDVKDYTIFFRAYRVGIVQRTVRACGDRFIESRGFASNAELLLKASRGGPLKCSEVPTVYRYDLKHGKSKMKIVSNAAEYFRMFRKVLGR